MQNSERNVLRNAIGETAMQKFALYNINIIFGAMIYGNVKLSNLFSELRLLMSLRLLRLLMSLRPQIFQGLENPY